MKSSNHCELTGFPFGLMKFIRTCRDRTMHKLSYNPVTAKHSKSDHKCAPGVPD